MPIPQAHVEKAIEQIEHRRRPSNIDFTQHVLEDGNVISTQERVIKEVRRPHRAFPRRRRLPSQVQAPAMNIPTDAQFFSKHDPSKPDVAFLKNHFYREGRLSEEHAIWIIDKATALLRLEPNVLQVDAPITGRSPPSSPALLR